MDIKRTSLFFWFFIKLLAKKWILWLFLVLDIVAAVIQIILPTVSISQGVYLGISIIGLVWASFQVYLDLLSKIPSETLPIKPSITVFLVEGHEYTYRLDRMVDRIYPQKTTKSKKGKNDEVYNILQKEALPTSLLLLHVRIENSGVSDFSLLTLTGNINVTHPYHFLVPQPESIDGSQFSFPYQIKPRESSLLNLCVPIHPYSLLTAAQVAARTRKLIQDNQLADIEIFAEIIDSSGNIYKHQFPFKVSIIPLCNLYLSLWSEMGANDLVDLATGKNFSPSQNETK